MIIPSSKVKQLMKANKLTFYPPLIIMVSSGVHLIYKSKEQIILLETEVFQSSLCEIKNPALFLLQREIFNIKKTTQLLIEFRSIEIHKTSLRSEC